MTQYNPSNHTPGHTDVLKVWERVYRGYAFLASSNHPSASEVSMILAEIIRNQDLNKGLTDPEYWEAISKMNGYYPHLISLLESMIHRFSLKYLKKDRAQTIEKYLLSAKSEIPEGLTEEEQKKFSAKCASSAVWAVTIYIENALSKMTSICRDSRKEEPYNKYVEANHMEVSPWAKFETLILGVMLDGYFERVAHYERIQEEKELRAQQRQRVEEITSSHPQSQRRMFST